AAFVQQLRSAPYGEHFQRAPGIAETVEWARALVALDTVNLDPEVVLDTAGILFKQRDDVAALDRALADEALQAARQAA
ncbi:MAG: MoxR family ATPase, partial [Proteobacteria bacterium]|nr:MoxR family ATPase [Pseudomonadota bacterium]